MADSRQIIVPGQPDSWMRCPRCGSARTRHYGEGLFWGAFKVVLSVGGCGALFIVLAYFFPRYIIHIGVVLGLAAIGLIAQPPYECLDCRHTWRVERAARKPAPARPSKEESSGAWIEDVAQDTRRDKQANKEWRSRRVAPRPQDPTAP